MFYRKKLINDLKLVDNVSITMDFWSNKQKKSFLVMTGHYFDTKDFNIQSTILDFSTFNKRHTAVEISRILKEKLQELGILEKIVCITADGAPNMVAAIEKAGFGTQRLWCIAHRLHLVITNAFCFWVKKDDLEENATTEAEEPGIIDLLCIIK
jgi:hypothetical protein